MFGLQLVEPQLVALAQDTNRAFAFYRGHFSPVRNPRQASVFGNNKRPHLIFEAHTCPIHGHLGRVPGCRWKGQHCQVTTNVTVTQEKRHLIHRVVSWTETSHVAINS